MLTLTFKAPEILNQRLEALALRQERPKSFLLRKAVELYLAEMEEDEEDIRIASGRLRRDNPKKRVSLKAIERKYGLDG